MKKRDYMVVSEAREEETFNKLADARKRAKQLSKKYCNVRINRWCQIDSDDEEMYFDEDFEIRYENGKEIKA